MPCHAKTSIPVLLASILSLGLTAAPTKAQRIYLDGVLERTAKSSASYYLEPEGPNANNGFAARIFTMDGTLKAAGSYADANYRSAHGHFVFYHPNGMVESEGNYIQGRKDGVWTRKDALGHELAERVYDAAPLRNLVYTLAQNMPKYPGGEKAMVRYVQERVGKTKGEVMASFIVEKDGQLTDLVVSGAEDQQTADQIASAISSAPRWEAGNQDGQPVRVQMRVPLN